MSRFVTDGTESGPIIGPSQIQNSACAMRFASSLSCSAALGASVTNMEVLVDRGEVFLPAISVTYPLRFFFVAALPKACSQRKENCLYNDLVLADVHHALNLRAASIA